MYTVHERVAAKTVNSCEEVYGPRPGIPSRAVIPCEVVHFSRLGDPTLILLIIIVAIDPESGHLC